MLKYLLLFLLLAAQPLAAFTLDALFKVDGENNRFFLLNNPDKEPVYLAINLSELRRKADGRYQESPLQPEAFLSWPIYLDPSELVIDGEGEVRVAVVRVAGPVAEDRILGITFVPDTLRQQAQTGSSISLAIGYKAWYLLPGTQPIQGAPAAWLANGQLHFANRSNKVLQMELDLCRDQSPPSGAERNICYAEALLLPGNSKTMALPTAITRPNGRVTFSDLTGDYRQEIMLPATGR
ncbi:hypothetical protein A9798_04560 [Edwardsiella hoshinae]|uniref:Uncharacterized protein n=1 Tax=Edwardsiella hoshinae TaxID=93378 RepID=A0A376DBF6_9GAMM|nr:hypothetical protein [Edwardsiella hoshinae]AOV96284.1 hypothetical protein A9798_04560 [Edwardsiella hoshinae]QPR27833.1 hypothetical protein I6G97_15725 [Edwardsiella hoshinae]STC85847.1 Uncharacterised protein [Edwardsiella hoshinae]